MEIASSLDFLWKQQARKELEEMSEMRRHTNQLLQNLLPLHVAKFFLHCDRNQRGSFNFNFNLHLKIHMLQPAPPGPHSAPHSKVHFSLWRNTLKKIFSFYSKLFPTSNNLPPLYFASSNIHHWKLSSSYRTSFHSMWPSSSSTVIGTREDFPLG